MRVHGGDWSVGAHAARVRPTIALEQALVILRRYERNEPLAICDREQRRFFAVHELLDEQLAAGNAKRAVDEHRVNRAVRFIECFTNDDAFPGGETGRLDHDRRPELARGTAGVVDICAGERARRRHIRVEHELLRERLGGLDLRCLTSRTEDEQPFGAKAIDDSVREWRFGTDDCQRDALAPGERHEGVKIRGGRAEACRHFGDTRIAGGGEEGECGIVFPESPREGVLAAATPDNQNLHLFVFQALLKASRARPNASPNCWNVSRVLAP